MGVAIRCLRVLSLALVASQAHAQDFIPYLDIEIDNQRYGRELRDNLERAHPSLREMPAAMSFTYRSTPVTQQAAIRQYLERLSKKDPKVAEKARTEFTRNDVTAIYTGIVAPFG